jgi:integrase
MPRNRDLAEHGIGAIHPREQADWPNFICDSGALEPLEKEFLLRSGEVVGACKHVGADDQASLKIEIISDEAVKTSEIEGEILNRIQRSVLVATAVRIGNRAAKADVDLSLVKRPAGALLCPGSYGADLTKLRNGTGVSHIFKHRAVKPGFPTLRFHDLRGSHATCLLDAGVPVHAVAARLGHDAAVLLRNYAKRTKNADDTAAAAIGVLFKGALEEVLAPIATKTHTVLISFFRQGDRKC